MHVEWTSCHDCDTVEREDFDEVERALFDMSLRPGVRRSEVFEYSVIDFVYSKRLRLRGLQRTCRSPTLAPPPLEARGACPLTC